MLFRSVSAVYYYDERYRLIQKQQTFYPGGYGITSTRYDFTGNVTATKEVQSVSQATNSLYTAYSYDHMKRPLETRMSLNQGDTILHSQIVYNELGQVKKKNLHSRDYLNVSQSVDYSYNIRGWLTRMNDPANPYVNNSLFSMELFYDSPPSGLNTKEWHNGNISALSWRHSSESAIKAYSYDYDGFQRLKGADYKINPGAEIGRAHV